jgi:hypothetical protein
MKILKPSCLEEITTHTLSFRYSDSEYFHGFTFDCDIDGNVDCAKLNPAALDNYCQCLSGDVNGRRVDEAVKDTYFRSYRRSAVGECVCGQEVSLSGFTNTCECGLDYNMSGQMLAPREQWGEECNEQWSDCYGGSLED